MCKNIAAGLSDLYPDKQPLIGQNLSAVTAEYEAAGLWRRETLKNLSCRELVTFHDGFSYFARAFGLTIAAAMEIEEGSEPSAKEIESVIRLVETEAIPAVFCEENGERQTAGDCREADLEPDCTRSQWAWTAARQAARTRFITTSTPSGRRFHDPTSAPARGRL